jgi:hypothetical protein
MLRGIDTKYARPRATTLLRAGRCTVGISITRRRTLDVKVPQGVPDGGKLRLRGQGGAGQPASSPRRIPLARLSSSSMRTTSIFRRRTLVLLLAAACSPVGRNDWHPSNHNGDLGFRLARAQARGRSAAA